MNTGERMSETNCLQCGKVNPPSKGNKPRKYCSAKCTRTYYSVAPEGYGDKSRERERIAKLNEERRAREGWSWGDKSRETKRQKEERRREYEETVNAGWVNYRDIAKDIGLTRGAVNIRVRELLEEGVETKKIHDGTAGMNGWKRYVHPDAIEKIINYQPEAFRGDVVKGLISSADAAAYCGYKGRATFLPAFKKLGFKADKVLEWHGHFFSKETIDAFLEKKTRIEEERSKARRLASLEKQRLKEQKEHERNIAREAKRIRDLEKQRIAQKIRAEKNKAKEEARAAQLEEVKQILKQQEKDVQARKASVGIKVPYIPKENTVEIPLWLKKNELSDKVAIIDEEDYDLVMEAVKPRSRWTLKYSKNKLNVYAIHSASKNNHIGMHAIIMNTPKGMHTDHINGYGLDNRKENLRVCTPQENHQNKKLRSDSSTGYKGVAYTPINKYKHTSKKTGAITIRESVLKKPYKAYIGDPERVGRHISLGNYATAEEAARARDAKAKELHGEFCYLNFPEE